MIDTRTALQAQEDATWLADHWAHLEARLRPGSTASLSEIRAPSPDLMLPIDLHVSDLMREVDDGIGRHYCHALIDETCDVSAVPATPEGRLRLVAERYGHWVTGEETTALAFCDEMAAYRERVRRVLERPLPPRYVGPCRAHGCPGELYAAEWVESGVCRECGTDWDGETQRAYLGEQMGDRLMTQTEIRRALTILGTPVDERTIRRWVARGSLVEDRPDSGLYPLVAALDLEARGRKHGKRVDAPATVL